MKMKKEIVKLSQVQINSSNPRNISETKFEKLINSILVLPKMLDLRPIIVDSTFVALGGNMRLRALTTISDMHEDELKCRLSESKDFRKKTTIEQNILLDYWVRWKNDPIVQIIKATELSEEEQREFIIKDNVGFGDWDLDLLKNEWEEEDLANWGLDMTWEDKGWECDNGKITSESANLSLNDRFVIPPFSIFDTRKGYWQDRKRKWRELIGDMGESRNDTLISSPEIKYKDLYQRTRQHREKLCISFKEYLDKYVSDDVKKHKESKVLFAGVSLFDPVLSEISCKWFTPNVGAKIFDCFSGDTQKGLVFGQCGYEFTGIELRQEQVDINNKIILGRGLPIKYICDDGQNVAQHIEVESQDLLFSCPPYYDLEKYSDLENDASNQENYEDFIKILDNAFKKAVTCLKENRFAVIVVGDIRNKSNGCYYDFCGDIKKIFKDAGMYLYNEIILVENCASTALRASRYMESRKVAKTHQNILVFYKGDTKEIKKQFPKIEFLQEDILQFGSEFNEQ